MLSVGIYYFHVEYDCVGPRLCRSGARTSKCATLRPLKLIRLKRESSRPPSSSRMELRCVVAVIRHGDRTPKQKMKLEVKHPMFFEIFRKYDGFKNKNIKLKKPQQLQEILDVSRRLLEYLKSGSSESELIEEKRSKLEQIKNVLEMYGTFQK